ncbi:uncharacterized protein LOC115876380 isoform X3 [Sitophilus oryzae]|nr:uncharacterized protein LOC115876380 isoform X3 [Sitophilus oryzae]XP_030747990.1 uncharacterized protein LOC115876380 isoform X3 [Sitophilus oryzae]
MQKSFYINENVCMACGVPQQPECFPELDGLLRRTATDGVSIVAVDKASGVVAGAAFNKLEESGHSDFFSEYAKCLKYSASKGVVQWMADADRMFDIYEHCKIDSLMEVMFVGILPTFRQRGIAKKLFEVSIELARELRTGRNVKLSVDERKLDIGRPPEIVSALLTSFITQKITRDTSFKVGKKMYFDWFVYDGRPLSEVIGPQTPFFTFEYYRL